MLWGKWNQVKHTPSRAGAGTGGKRKRKLLWKVWSRREDWKQLAFSSLNWKHRGELKTQFRCRLIYKKKGDEESEYSHWLVACKNVYLGIRKNNAQLQGHIPLGIQGHIPLGIQDSPQEDFKNIYKNYPARTYLKQMAGLHKFFKYLSMQHSHKSMIFEN